MLAGVDWGGTNIELVAITPDGVEQLHLREKTPRGDDAACLAVIAGGMPNVGELYERLPDAVAVHGITSAGRGAAWLWAEEPA